MSWAYDIRILSEETIEVKDTREGAIEKLRWLPEVCRESRDNEKIAFHCSKKGNIRVHSYQYIEGRRRNADRRYSAYYVYGKVLSENQKTVVRLYAAYKVPRLLFRVLVAIGLLISCILFMFGLWILIIRVIDSILWQILLTGILIPVLLLLFRGIVIGEKDLETNNVDLLIDDVRKRIEAVNRWDE